MAKRSSNVSTGPKELLLERTIGYLAEHGVIDVSLRALAAAIGTSHRMLIYHFGSKDGLFVAVVRAVEARQRAAFSDLVVSSGDSLSDVARQFWRRLSDPALAPTSGCSSRCTDKPFKADPTLLPFSTASSTRGSGP